MTADKRPGLVDLHHHLAHGVDDGPRCWEDTVAMLRRAHACGVRKLAATCHITPGAPFDAQRYWDSLCQARQYCRENGLDLLLYTGSEVLYTQETPRLLRQGQVPTLGESRTVLVEFLPSVTLEELCRAAREIGNAGFTVLLAHVERYACLRQDGGLEQLREDYLVQAQMNANTVLKNRSWLGERWVKRALKRGLIDVIASDAHNVTIRPCQLGECYDALCADLGRETANRLCFTTPEKLLK